MNTGSQYKKLCWKLDQMGAVGETALHVCLLNATSIHADLAKRLLKIYPNLINDIYISDEYYGKIGFCFSVLVEHVETCSVAEPGAGTGLGALAFFVSKFINNMVTTRFHFGRAVCHPISFYMVFLYSLIVYASLSSNSGSAAESTWPCYSVKVKYHQNKVVYSNDSSINTLRF